MRFYAHSDYPRSVALGLSAFRDVDGYGVHWGVEIDFLFWTWGAEVLT